MNNSQDLFFHLPQTKCSARKTGPGPLDLTFLEWPKQPRQSSPKKKTLMKANSAIDYLEKVW